MNKPSAIQIFLAHANEDKPQVRQLYQKLQEAGYQPWLDERDLIAGQNWQNEIPKAIRRSDIFIACLSSQSVKKSGSFQKELRLALNVMAEMLEEEIYLIPLKLDECEVPDLQQAEYGVKLRDIQWLDYWQPDGWNRLLQAIAFKSEQAKDEQSIGVEALLNWAKSPSVRQVLDEIRYNIANKQSQKTNASTEVSPSLQTFPSTTPNPNISRHLNYSSRSLSSLKKKFYDFLIRIDEQNQPIMITAKDIEDWLKEIELTEKQIQVIRQNLNKREE